MWKPLTLWLKRSDESTQGFHGYDACVAKM